MIGKIMNVSSPYSSLISWLSGGGTVSDAVGHIDGGMIIFLAVRVVAGRSLASPGPLLR